MASENQIWMNFTTAKQRASELENVAERLEKLTGRDFKGILDGLAADWKGENSIQYVRKGNELQEKMEKSADSIRKVAATIRQVAKNIYDAEMEALRIAQERKVQAQKKASAEAGGQGAFGFSGEGSR